MLLAFPASGAVSAKTASGPQNLGPGLQQGESIVKPLMHQGKTESSYGGMSGSPVVTKGVGNVTPDNIVAPGPVNFMSDSDRFFNNISKRSDVDPNGYFDVVAHGSPNKIQIETPNGSVLVDHRTSARLIQQQPGYTGQNIRLLSCNTGACDTGFAQNLANKLNVEVQAPTDLLWAYPNGKTVVAPKGVNGLPDLSNTGKIKNFLPNKSQ